MWKTSASTLVHNVTSECVFRARVLLETLPIASAKTCLFKRLCVMFEASKVICCIVFECQNGRKWGPEQSWNHSGVPLAPVDAPGHHVREVSPRKCHSLGGFWGLTCDTFLSFFSSCFVSAFLNCSFGAFATTRVPKVAKKGAKMEPKALPERFCDMCQKHGIYRTGSTSDPPGSVLKPDNSSNSCREAPWRVPEAHVCDSSTVLGPPLASILCSWSLRFSVHFLDAFLKRPTTS